MDLDNPVLAELGWKTFFTTQLSTDDLSRVVPVRIMAVHRGRIAVAGEEPERLVPSRMPGAASEEDRPTVGDWLLVDSETGRPVRILDRASLFRRRAPGAGRGVQLIAANVDTLFIVSSCNQDFNVARLERYLVLAREAGATPLIVLTKADLSDDAADFAAQARNLQSGLMVETVDARDPSSVACLAGWCGKGATVALLGSSGVGKSTLVNTLTGSATLATRDVRKDDDKGRHTTTARALHRLAGGGWLLDTPGMRELQLTDTTSGLEEVFDDVAVLAESCRFADCSHDTEPGCAVRAAIDAGDLDAGRLVRWRKLAAEDARNTETLAERRTRQRAFGKMVRSTMAAKNRRRRE